MFTGEIISLATALVELAKPIVELICHWIKHVINKRSSRPSIMVVRCSHRLVYPLTCHSCPIAFISSPSIIFSFFCKTSEHVGEHCGIGSGCFASDDSGKICGVLCGVQAGSELSCLLLLLANSGSQASRSNGSARCFSLSIFNSLITGDSPPLFNNSGCRLRVRLL